eukprot:1177912-Prorocentrum_minimum.AAC.1
MPSEASASNNPGGRPIYYVSRPPLHPLKAFHDVMTWLENERSLFPEPILLFRKRSIGMQWSADDAVQAPANLETPSRPPQDPLQTPSTLPRDPLETPSRPPPDP